MRETQVRSLGQEDPLGKEVAICSSILAWKFSWTQRSLAGYSPWGHKGSDVTEQLSAHTQCGPGFTLRHTVSLIYRVCSISKVSLELYHNVIFETW